MKQSMRILLNIPLSPRLSPFNVNQEKDIRKIKKKKKISLQSRYDDNIVNYVQMKWIIKRNDSLAMGNEVIERKN